MDAQNVAQSIRFDAEDRLPPAYWDRLRPPPPKMEEGVTNGISQNGGKIDPKEWAKAPAFVPRQTTLASSFGYSNPLSNIPFNNNGINYGSTTSGNFEANIASSSSSHRTSDFIPMPPPPPLTSTAAPNGVPYNYQQIFNQTPPPLSSHYPPSPFQPCVSVPHSSVGKLGGFVPKGYSANFASINSGIGPPIAAIILKKKRRRRSRRINMTDFDQHKNGIQHPNDPNNGGSLNDVKRHPWDGEEKDSSTSSSKPFLFKHPNKIMPGQIRSMSSEPDLPSMTNLENCGRQFNGRLTSVDSCPELSEDQRESWDDYLFNNIVKKSTMKQNPTKKMRTELSAAKISSRSQTPELPQKPKSESPVMRTSIYELCPASIYDEDNNVEFVDDQEREKFLEEMSNSRSAVFDPSFSAELKNSKPIDRPKTIEDSFNLIQQSSNELEDLKFKPLPLQKEQITLSSSQYMTYYNPKTNGLKNEIYNPDYDLDPQIEQDYFEGMRIRVNAFEDCEDLELSESECPEPSRFQQLQWALQRKRERYVELAPPDRVCCSLM